MSFLAISSAMALEMSVDCCIQCTEIINKIIQTQIEKKKHKFVKVGDRRGIGWEK